MHHISAWTLDEVFRPQTVSINFPFAKIQPENCIGVWAEQTPMLGDPMFAAAANPR
jgi:hypothetical protein